VFWRITISIIRRKSYELLADEFSKYRNIDDTFSRLRGTLDNSELLEILVLLDSKGHLNSIMEQIEDFVHCEIELDETLDLDITGFANRFFLRLVNLRAANS